MGVPAFFAWLLKKYKNSNFVFKKQENEDIPIDWFLIDTNCLCHPVCFKILHEEQDKPNINFKSLQNKMFNAIIDEIEKLVKYANPKIGVYIAIDGPVGVSKMKQQRQRRFRSVYDHTFFNKIKIKHNRPLTYYWNNSAISPGTKWMEKLHNKIIEWCLKQKYKIIYSSANTEGEGEHKLLQFIRNNKEDNSYLTYGLDADLIFLMLSTKLDNIYLLREANQLNKNILTDELNYVSLKIMKECIYNTFTTTKDKNRIINDFIFLCYFLGNDFLPHLPSLKIKQNGIEYLIKYYNEIEEDYLLSEDCKIINYDFLQKFINNIGNDEEFILNKYYNGKKHFRSCYSQEPYDKELFKIENLLFKINDPIGIGVDSNYRNNYYKHNFKINEEEIEEFVKELVKEYLIGLKWITLYYFDKIPDWYWHYPYDYPPFLTDIKKYLFDINIIKFKEGKSMAPFEQLLMILPQQSNYLLPKTFSKLVTNKKSSINHLYPLYFKIDFLYKSKYYEGIPLLPNFNIKLIKHSYNKYKDELLEDETHRNRIEKEYYFNF